MQPAIHNTHTHTHTHTCTYIYTDTHQTHTRTHTYIYMYMYAHLNNIHLSIHIHTLIHTYTYMHTHTHTVSKHVSLAHTHSVKACFPHSTAFSSKDCSCMSGVTVYRHHSLYLQASVSRTHASTFRKTNHVTSPATQCTIGSLSNIQHYNMGYTQCVYTCIYVCIFLQA